MNLRIKICGMREPENIRDVALLKPDMLGFIFYPSSSRFAGNMDPKILNDLQTGIRKTGVFVDSDPDTITGTVKRYSLDMVQLHGDETPEMCYPLREQGLEIIKVFRIGENFNFKPCSEYIFCTDYFLFDTSGNAYGGSGLKFNWKELKNYNLEHPFILSGGISPDDAEKISEIDNPGFFGIDLNSRFEITPGIKDTVSLGKFISEIRKIVK